LKHEHLPALNRYTSPNQYAALQEVDKTRSITTLVTQGRMGTTIGALIRSAWMDSEVITDAEGVTSERWFVTDAGRHAMQLYEIKAEQERQKAEQREKTERLLREAREQQERAEREVLAKTAAYFAHKKKVEEELGVMWDEVVKEVERVVPRGEYTYMLNAAKRMAGYPTSSGTNSKYGSYIDVRNDPQW
jgi:hypothetical protein